MAAGRCLESEDPPAVFSYLQEVKSGILRSGWVLLWEYLNWVYWKYSLSWEYWNETNPLLEHGIKAQIQRRSEAGPGSEAVSLIRAINEKADAIPRGKLFLDYLLILTPMNHQKYSCKHTGSIYWIFSSKHLWAWQQESQPQAGSITLAIDLRWNLRHRFTMVLYVHVKYVNGKLRFVCCYSIRTPILAPILSTWNAGSGSDTEFGRR